MTISVEGSAERGREDGVRQRHRGVEVTGPGAQRWSLNSGQRLLFGRGPGADLALAPDPWVSRLAGEITVCDDGVRVTNVSTRHPLWLEANGDRVRLPVMASGTGNIGCFLATGRASMGPGEVPDYEQSVRVLLSDRAPVASSATCTLDPGTKEFMVALLLCRPWLLDPLRIRPLPSAPQIAEEALAITGAYRQWRRFELDPGSRSRLAAQVHDHLRCLRAKIRRSELISPDQELQMPAIASVLIHYGLIAPRHLELCHDAAWLTAQEDKWWSTPA